MALGEGRPPQELHTATWGPDSSSQHPSVEMGEGCGLLEEGTSSLGVASIHENILTVGGPLTSLQGSLLGKAQT